MSIHGSTNRHSQCGFLGYTMRALALCTAAAISVAASADVLVYEGFSSSDYGANATLNGKKSGIDSVGLDTASGWSSSTGVFTSQNDGLSLPTSWTSAGSNVHGTKDRRVALVNSSSLGTWIGRRTQQRLITCTWPTSGSIYFRFLMGVPQACLSTAYLGNGNYCMAGIGAKISDPAGNTCAITDGIYMGFRNNNGTIEFCASLASGGNVQNVKLFDIDTTKRLDCACVAKIDFSDGGMDGLSLYACPVDEWDDEFSWTYSVSNLGGGALSSMYLQMIGQYPTASNQISFDEFIVTTDASEAYFYRTAGSPFLGDISLSRTGTAAYSLSAVEAANEADLSWVASDGESAATNGTTTVAENSSANWTLSGFATDKTYGISVLAENDAGVYSRDAGVIYTGELALGEVTPASEETMTAGTVAVSRDEASPFPLTVNYTISGTKGSEGITWAVPSAVTIPAGQKTGYLLVTPLADVTVTEDIEVTVTLAAGNYEIPASSEDNSRTVVIENGSTPAGYKIITIVNALDNPDGGFFGAAYGSALNITANTIIKFVSPDNSPSGLREFAQYAGDWVYIDNGEDLFTRDWMLSVSANKPSAGETVTYVRCASEAVTGLRDRADVRTYMGSWYVPANGTYSFRMHMNYAGLFALDGKLILRQATSSAVTTNDVVLTAGWHSFYAAFLSSYSSSNSKIGPGSNETLGFSYSALNEDLAANPSAGQAFDGTGGHTFRTAFNAVLIPSMWASGGDVTIDCANLSGDLRVTGQIAGTGDHVFTFANLPAGRTLEVGRPAVINLTGPQELTGCAYLEWPRIKLPAGVGIRFEGVSAIDASWTQAGRGVWSTGDHSAFSLGNYVSLFTDVAGFLGTYDDEFHYPDGLCAFHAGTPDVLGTTAKIFVPRYGAFGFGGAPFTLSESSGAKKLPVTRVLATNFNFPNDVELGYYAAVNKSLTANNGTDRISGYVNGPDGSARITGYSSYMRLAGSVNVKDVSVGQLGCRTSFLPKAGSAPSSISGTLTLGADIKTYPTSGWDYCGPNFCYCPETPGEQPLSVNIVKSSGARYCPENVGNNSWAFAHTTRHGSNLSTCSNNTVNVAQLIGSGIHLRATVPFPSAQGIDERKYEKGAGFANFVFGEINGSASMPIFISTNVNITVTNLAKAVAFHYEVMSNGVNEAVLDIENPESAGVAGSTITATDVAMLPGRIKGFTGSITLTETNQTETVTYPVVYDFDRGVAIGGCDGSGTLLSAPANAHIELSFAGTPSKGRFGVLRFDNANNLLANWTISAQNTYYKGFGIELVHDANGFSFKTSNGFKFMLR